MTASRRTVLTAIAVAALALIAFSPALTGEFLDLDDMRFVPTNPAIRDLDFGRAFTFFTDPSTSTPQGWVGIYRPLRTLDFAIDWAIGGGDPFVYHLHSALYHALASVLVLFLLRRLAPDAPQAACLGALVFAVHPVQTEAVAWITSRADVLLLCTFLGTLLAYVARRRVLTVALFVVALFSKETAVMFPAAAILTDLVRRERPRWALLGICSVLAIGFTLLWQSFMPMLGHREEFWGGSRLATLQTMARGGLYYFWLVILPVRLLVDYMMPALSGFDAGAILGTLLVAGAAAACVFGGRRARFVVLWFFVTMLPTSNLIFRIGIPTAERFLYLPMVGLAFGAGLILSKARIGWAVIPCFLALSISRSQDWRTSEQLFDATRKVEGTPITLNLDVQRAWEAMDRARDGSDPASLRGRAEAVLRAFDALTSMAHARVGPDVPFGGEANWRRADALLILGRPAEALAAARASEEQGSGVTARMVTGLALVRLDRVEEAIDAAERTGPHLDLAPPLRRILGRLLTRIAGRLLERGEVARARQIYLHSWEVYPDPIGNREAFDVKRSLDR